MERVRDWRLRKCSDVEREYAYLELLHNEAIVMEIAATDEGEIEVLFETGAPGRLFTVTDLRRALEEAQKLLEEEIASTA